VLTEPTFFDGSIDHLRAVREAVSIPVLRKDFIVTRYQVYEAAAHGADAILLILGALDDDTFHDLLTLAMSLGIAVLSEVHDSAELDRAFTKGANLIGVNSRNLRTLAVDHDVLEDVARVFGTPGSLFVAESGIRTAADMARLRTLGYHAFLVGERLITQPDPGAALRELRSS